MASPSELVPDQQTNGTRADRERVSKRHAYVDRTAIS